MAGMQILQELLSTLLSTVLKNSMETTLEMINLFFVHSHIKLRVYDKYFSF